MKRIVLTQGKEAIVDDADYEWLSQWKWAACLISGRWYVSHWDSSHKRMIHMHRYLLKTDAPHIDHINGDGLDNRRENLRPATVSQNQWNRRKNTNGTSQFKGVSRGCGCWRAYIRIHRQKKYLGQFSTEELAAAAYRKAASALFGEYARMA